MSAVSLRPLRGRERRDLIQAFSMPGYLLDPSGIGERVFANRVRYVESGLANHNLYRATFDFSDYLLNRRCGRLARIGHGPD